MIIWVWYCEVGGCDPVLFYTEIQARAYWEARDNGHGVVEGIEVTPTNNVSPEKPEV